MKYKILTLAVSYSLAACGAEEASNVNSVIDNVQEGQQEPEIESDEYDTVEVNTSVRTPKNRTTTTTTTTTVSSSSSSEVGGLPDAGVLSFSYSAMDYKCSNWEEGRIAGMSLEMEYWIEDGMIFIQQTQRQNVQGQMKQQVLNQEASASLISGLIEADGSFIATGTSEIVDPQNGPIHAFYTIDGLLTESGWAGDYSFTSDVKDWFVTCTYETKFSGSMR